MACVDGSIDTRAKVALLILFAQLLISRMLTSRILRKTSPSKWPPSIVSLIAILTQFL